MAVISNSTFDPLRDFVNTRLAQGVPIVDADWNELDDIRKFEVRAYLKWFVGNGVPEGNNGFEIDGSGALNNDFFIHAGVGPAPVGTDHVIVGLDYVGRCIVDGLDVTIASDTQFTAQPLHVSQAGSAALAAQLGVPQILAMQTPTADGTACVYLDVWERLVTPAEMPSLILPGLGTESCSRIKREWVVRARTGTSAPMPVDTDYIGGHFYYAVATINRRNGDPVVNAGDVRDLRERRLLMLPSYLTEDVLGTKFFDYRQGLDRPVVSLREAINALLHGDMLASTDAAIAPDPALDSISRGFLLDNSNGVIAVWQSQRAAATDQIFAARIDRGDFGSGFGSVTQITSGAAHYVPHAALAPNGDILVTYQTGLGPAGDVFYRRGQYGALGAATEVTIANTAAGETHPFVVITGNIATFFYRLDPPKQWQYRRRQLNPDLWLDAVPVAIPSPPAVTDDFHAAAAADGSIWAAFPIGAAGIQVQRLNPGTGVIDSVAQRTSGVPSDHQAFVVVLKNTDVGVFWSSATGLWTTLFDHTTATWSTTSPVSGAPAGAIQPTAVQDDRQGVWLFYSYKPGLANFFLFYIRRDLSGFLSTPRQVTSIGNDVAPFVLFDPNDALWLFWASDRTGGINDIFFKRIITTV